MKKKIVDIAGVVKKYIADNFETQTLAADHFGCSPQMISMVVAGKKPPTKAMLDEMGIVKERTVSYKVK